MEVYTNWTKATTSPHEALMGLISCVESGKDAWIEVRKNGNQDFPIMKRNPVLENPFAWDMNYGVFRNEEEMAQHHYFNETEKDLTYHWVACFGEEDAVKKYQESGTVSKGLINGCGVCCPIRIEDANFYRENISGDGYRYGAWVNFWKPKEGIPYWVIDENITEVFTICYCNEPVIKSKAIKKAAIFMMKYADKLEKAEKGAN